MRPVDRRQGVQSFDLTLAAQAGMGVQSRRVEHARAWLAGCVQLALRDEALKAPGVNAQRGAGGGLINFIAHPSRPGGAGSQKLVTSNRRGSVMMSVGRKGWDSSSPSSERARESAT